MNEKTRRGRGRSKTRPSRLLLFAFPLLALALSTAARDARAGAGTVFSESSRAAALGDAVVARPGDASTMLENPAGLADLVEPVVLLGGHVDRLNAWFARTGEPQEDRGRTFGGFTLAAATPLPGPEWLRRVRAGIALDMPAQYALHIAVADRTDTPTSPLYDARPDRMSSIAALAVDLTERFKLGLGVMLAPSLTAPTYVNYVAGRDTSIQRDVEVRLDRSLDMGLAPFLGLRAQATRDFSVGLAYRGEQVSKATGTQRTVAGGILANDPIDYLAYWSPAEYTAGVAWAALARFSVSLDLTLHRWSGFADGFDRTPDQPFHDTLSVRSGVEWRTSRWLALRGGWAVEPSPIPEQVGQTNYLGSSALTVAAGAGVDLRELAHAPLAVDAHVRTLLGGTQSATKLYGALPDADPSLPGTQYDNLGLPGFQSHASLYQIGVTVTLFVGKGAAR
jgi:hypothetical protein